MHQLIIKHFGDPASFCVQSEYGDIYRVSLDYTGETVKEVVIKYFDTIPPCTSICVLKTGFLFAGSEFGNHALYQFQVGVRQLIKHRKSIFRFYIHRFY